MERVDHLKLEFDSSPVKKKLLELKNVDEPKIKEFAKIWYNYRNEVCYIR